MRRIEAAENSVPIGIVALAAQHERFGLVASGEKRLVVPAAPLEAANFRRNVLHFLVQKIRFVILREEISPNAAAQESHVCRTVDELCGESVVADTSWCRKRPFHHFGVRSSRKIG